MANNRNNKPKSKRSVSDIITEMTTNLAADEAKITEIPDIITFIEDEKYLGLGAGVFKHVKLYPIQKAILKVFYRGSRGNEKLALTEEEVQLLKKEGLWREHPDAECDRGDLLGKYLSGNTFRELVLVWGRRCLSEDTQYTDPATGKVRTFGQMWDDGFTSNIQSWTLDERTGDMVVIPNCNLLNQGVREVFRVITQSGHEIEATDNHPLYTQSGWKKVSEIQPGKDKIAIVREEPFFGKSDEISECEAALLGYITGDGCCSQRSIHFTCSDEAVKKHFEECLNKFDPDAELFLDPWTKAKSKKYQYKIRQKAENTKQEKYFNEKTQRVMSRMAKTPIQKLLEQHGLMGKTCHLKTAPRALFECPKNVIAAYLRALFSCDGSVVVSKNSNDARICLTTVNVNQAKAVQSLLRRFGISAKIRKRCQHTFIKTENKEYDSVSYELYFRDTRSLLAFVEKVGIIRDNQKLEDLKSKICCREYIRKGDCNYDLSKVLRVERIGEKRTFDLQVSCEKSLQNYVAQGVISHNSGKDFIVSLIALYEAMRLLEVPGGDPYEYYGLAPGADITILTIAASQEQAAIAFREIREKLRYSKYFQGKFYPQGLQADSITLLTPRDLADNKKFAEKGQQIKLGSIKIEVGHSNPDTLVGKSCYILILDEVASYKTGTQGAGSGEKIYALLQPTTASYVHGELVFDDKGEPVIDPETGEQKVNYIYEGKVISISSPRGKEGKLWELWTKHWDDGKVLGCRLPTWIVNKRQTQENLRREFASMSQTEFNCEFGAEFTGSAGENMFPPDIVEAAFKNNLKMRDVGQPGRVYFVQLDPATNSHNYALVVVHKDTFVNPETKKTDFIIIVDHIAYWTPTPDRMVEVSDVDDYVCNLRRRFHLGFVAYDAWQSVSSIQKLRKAGIPADMRKYVRQYKMEIYAELEELLKTGRLKIPYEPSKTSNVHSPSELLRQEMLHLQRKYDGNGWKVYPKKDGDACKTDDVVDALAGAVYLAVSTAAMRLPRGRTVSVGITPSANNIVWRSMQGTPYGVGPGEMVAKNLERRSSWPYWKR